MESINLETENYNDLNTKRDSSPCHKRIKISEKDGSRSHGDAVSNRSPTSERCTVPPRDPMNASQSKSVERDVDRTSSTCNGDGQSPVDKLRLEKQGKSADEEVINGGEEVNNGAIDSGDEGKRASDQVNDDSDSDSDVELNSDCQDSNSSESNSSCVSAESCFSCDLDDDYNCANLERDQDVIEDFDEFLTDKEIAELRPSTRKVLLQLYLRDYNPRRSLISFLNKFRKLKFSPKEILEECCSRPFDLPENFDESSLWFSLVEFFRAFKVRKKIVEFNSLSKVVEHIRNAKNIIILTGAGVSVSCGIPDFRSKDGIYAKLSKEFPDLPNPTSMFDMRYFMENPYPFFKFAKEIFPGSIKPSLCHRFIARLEKTGHLLRNFTQNIDTLEQAAGINNVCQCHGSFASATCLSCRAKVDCEDIRDDIFKQIIPRCKSCHNGIMKPDIIFFGEDLSRDYYDKISRDRMKCDLFICIGSSMKVRPVSLIPGMIKRKVPQILINREDINDLNFDIRLLGNADVIVSELCNLLGDDFSGLQGVQAPLKYVDFHDESIQGQLSSAQQSTSTDEAHPTGLLDRLKSFPVDSRRQVLPSSVEISRGDEPGGDTNEPSATSSKRSNHSSQSSIKSAIAGPADASNDVCSDNSASTPSTTDSKSDTPTTDSPASKHRENHAKPPGEDDSSDGSSSTNPPKLKHSKIQNKDKDDEEKTTIDPMICPNCDLPCITKFRGKCMECMVFEKRLVITKQRKYKLRMSQQNKSITNFMPDESYTYIEPNTYVFLGAQVFSHQLKDLQMMEVYDATSSSSSSSEDDDSSSIDDGGAEIDVTGPSSSATHHASSPPSSPPSPLSSSPNKQPLSSKPINKKSK